MKRWCALVAAAMVLGCGGAAPKPAAAAKSAKVAFDEVPASVMDVARRKLGGAEATEAFRRTEPDGKTLKGYELKGRGKESGKTLRVLVAPDGRILESEGFEKDRE